MEVNSSTLPLLLKKINSIKSVETFLASPIDSGAMAAYYASMRHVYRRFHSKEGAMHMPIKTNETERHRYKLLYQARLVEKLIQEHGYTTIVEMGCGQGFNSLYLARLFPQVQFLAMDITEANLVAARKAAKDLPNLRFQCFDYNKDAHHYQADLIFGVETLCYAKDFGKLLKHLSSCLSVSGRIVIFDAYETSADLPSRLNEETRLAYRLLCKGFLLERFQSLDEVYKAIQDNALLLESDKDYTQGILPNNKVFQQGCLKALAYPRIIRLLLKSGLLPEAGFLQVPSGLFGAYFFEQQWLTYRQLIIKKA